MTADEYQRREAILADIQREAMEREARASVAVSDHCEVCGEVADPEEGHALCVGMIARERDELAEQVTRLQAALQQERDDAFTEAEYWQRRVAERDSLHAALERYGRHGRTCERAAGNRLTVGTCDCGLAEALKGAEKG